jgi:RNA polymerase sigma factor (sigma-70 family)
MSDALARSLATLTRRLAVQKETDSALLARFFSSKDSAAFAEMVRRHGPLVLGVCRRILGHVHDAEDAFQATFLVLARNARSVRKPEALSAWLYGTALRVCRKAAGKRRLCTPPRIQADLVAGDDPFAETAWKEVRGVLDDEMGRLPETLRVPLILCYFEGLSRDEAAEKLGCSRRTLIRRLEKARARLRTRLERRGVATVGLGVAVLVSGELSAFVPERTAAAAIAAGAGGPVSASVQALAGAGATIKLLPLAVGLLLLLAGGGIGLAALSIQPVPNEHAIPSSPKPVADLEDRNTQTPEKAKPLDADGLPLPAGAIRRLGSRRYRIEGRSDFILPTPDGRYVLTHPQPSISGSPVHGLMLLDLDTGLRVRSFEEGRRVAKSISMEAIRPAAFSPDGKKLYSLAWHKSEEAGRQIHPWADFDNPCRRVLLVWDVATGKVQSEWDLPSGNLFGPPPSLIGVNVSPDGKRLYVYGAIRMQSVPGQVGRGLPGLHVLDAATGKKLQTWDGAGCPVGTTAEGKELIAFRRGAEITAHDVQTGKPVRTYPLAGYIASVALSVDGKVIAAAGIAGEGEKKTCEIKIWESTTGRELRRSTADVATVGYGARLLFSADGKTLFLGAGKGHILRWDVSSGRALPDWTAHNGMIADLFRRTGKNELLSAGQTDGAIHRWDAATGKSLSTTNAYVGDIAVARMPDGKGLVVVDASGRLDVWDTATGRITKTLQTPGRNKHEILFTPSGKHLLLAARNGPNTIWDLSAGKQVGEFAPPPKLDPKADEYWWGALGFSPDGRQLVATKFGRGTWMWTWPERKLLWHQAKELECCFFPDADALICGDWHNAIEIRDPRTGSMRRTIAAKGMSHVAFSHDRRRMVTTSLDGAWRLRDATTGAVLKEVKGWQYVWSVAFSPSGWQLAVAGDKSVRVYDTASWQEIARFDGHEGTVRTVLFGPDDATLITASGEDGTALVWSLRPPVSPELPDPDKLWDDLASDGQTARRAVWAAAQYPDLAIKLFRRKWPIPQHAIDGERIRKLIGKLDDATFAERETAEAELRKLGRQAESELRKALAEANSPEVKRRTKRIVDRWSPPATAEYSAGEARELRAIWALELAGTAEAKKLLQEWAAARIGNRLCEEANAAQPVATEVKTANEPEA